jgi:hypothetical protein
VERRREHLDSGLGGRHEGEGRSAPPDREHLPLGVRGPYKPAEWVNGTESDLSFGATDNTGYATGVALVGDDTYISGISTNNYYNAGTVGYWKNGTWTTLPTEFGDDIPTYAIGVW